MKITNETKLDFDDILLVPARSTTASRKLVELKRNYKFFHSPKEWSGLPIMAANMDTTGSFNMASTLNIYDAITCLHKHYDSKQINDYFQYYNHEKNVWISIGMDDSELSRIREISTELHHSPNICIDIANGYTNRFVDFCRDVRYSFPDSIIMAGNVCTPEMVQELIINGLVDIVKIGIGGGSACTTRLKTGVGYPQLSAIIECSHAAHGLRSGDGRLGLICSDGGCRNAGDVAKAYAAGADFVMLGGMLAGTDECEGEWEYEDDGTTKKSLLFYGMSSEKAQIKYNDGINEYATSEGRVKSTPFKGTAYSVMKDITGGLRSCCAYIGATKLKDLSKCAKAVQVNRVHYDNKV